MKKYLGAIISGLLGVLAFVFLSLPNLAATALGETDTINAWDLLKDETSADIAGYGLYKFATIALIVVAVILIICAVVMLLKNVLKIKFNLNIINNIVLAVFALLAIMAIIALFIIAGDMQELMALINGSVAVGIGAWFNAVLAVVGCVCGWVFARE